MAAIIYRRAFVPQIIGRCNFHRWFRPVLSELYRRRKRIGPEPKKHRSVQSNWNYAAELFAFGQRLQEPFSSDTLRKVFTHESYIAQEERKRQELGLENPVLNLEDNSSLTREGEKIITNYVKSYLRFTFPYLPEEGVCAIHDFLVSDEILSHVSSNIGTTDLILCEDFPPTSSTLSKTMKALIGAISHEKGLRHADLFVQDFILTQLIGQDVNEMWSISNPMGVLVDIFKREGRELPESRLVREGGRNTIQAVYNVGIYSCKKMIGLGFGETVTIAEEMAARDALKRLFRTTESKDPLPFGKAGRELNIPKEIPTISISNWTSEIAEQKALSLEQR